MTTFPTEEKAAPAVAVSAQETKLEKKPHTAAQKPRVAPGKGRAGKKATAGKKAPKPGKAAKAAKVPKRPNPERKPEAAREGSKTAKILDLMKRPDGATLQQIMKATGWQPHSVRGFISGTLGKKMGLTVVSTKREDGERVYNVPK